MSKKDSPFKGWECPRCKQINAPWVPFCDCKEEEEKKNSETVTWDYNGWDKLTTTTGTPLDKYIYTSVNTSNAIHPNTVTLDSVIGNVAPLNTTLNDKEE